MNATDIFETNMWHSVSSIDNYIFLLEITAMPLLYKGLVQDSYDGRPLNYNKVLGDFPQISFGK